MTSMITETLAITGPLHREAEWIKKRSHKHKHTQKNDICGLTHLWEVPYRPLMCFLIIPKHTHARADTPKMHVVDLTVSHVYVATHII